MKTRMAVLVGVGAVTASAIWLSMARLAVAAVAGPQADTPDAAVAPALTPTGAVAIASSPDNADPEAQAAREAYVRAKARLDEKIKARRDADQTNKSVKLTAELAIVDELKNRLEVELRSDATSGVPPAAAQAPVPAEKPVAAVPVVEAKPAPVTPAPVAAVVPPAPAPAVVAVAPVKVQPSVPCVSTTVVAAAETCATKPAEPCAAKPGAVCAAKPAEACAMKPGEVCAMKPGEVCCMAATNAAACTVVAADVEKETVTCCSEKKPGLVGRMFGHGAKSETKTCPVVSVAVETSTPVKVEAPEVKPPESLAKRGGSAAALRQGCIFGA